MTTRTILEIDARGEPLSNCVTLGSLRAMVAGPAVRDALQRGEAVEILPGVRAVALRHDSDGLTVRVGNGAAATTHSEPGAPHATA